jgi:hypothetical protein
MSAFQFPLSGSQRQEPPLDADMSHFQFPLSGSQNYRLVVTQSELYGHSFQFPLSGSPPRPSEQLDEGVDLVLSIPSLGITDVQDALDLL